jgi:hypothetical protein
MVVKLPILVGHAAPTESVKPNNPLHSGRILHHYP